MYFGGAVGAAHPQGLEVVLFGDEQDLPSLGVLDLLQLLEPFLVDPLGFDVLVEVHVVAHLLLFALWLLCWVLLDLYRAQPLVD